VNRLYLIILFIVLICGIIGIATILKSGQL